MSLALLGFLGWRMDLVRFWDVFFGARLSLIAVATALYLATVTISIARWKLVLADFSMKPPLIPLGKISLIGYFFNLFLPSAFGGDFFRAYYLSKRERRGMSSTLVTTFLDRSAGMLALLLIGTAAVVIHPIRIGGQPILPFFILLAVVFFAALFALFHERTHRRLQKLLERFKRPEIEQKMELVTSGLYTLRRHPGSIASILALSVLIQLMVVVVLWILAGSIAIDAPFGVFLIFIPIINLATAVPLTINGLGLREYVYYLLFSEIGVEMETAVTLSLLNFFLVVVSALPGGVVYSFYKQEVEEVGGYPPTEITEVAQRDTE